jgi:GntR family uxuAB operon transcriptional repressor
MRGRKYLSVAQTLRDMLVAQRWDVGERLPAERALSEELGVPRATIREALIVLEVEGLLEVRHASGIYVCDGMPTARPDLPVDMSPFELLRARQVLESAIASAAALNVSDEQIDDMRQALDQEERDISDRRGSYEGDKRFHALLAEATQNDALIATMEQLWSLRLASALWNQLHSRIFDDDYRRSWAADHHEILAAIEARDPESARAATWRHLGNVSRTLLILSDPDVIPPSDKQPDLLARTQ